MKIITKILTARYKILIRRIPISLFTTDKIFNSLRQHLSSITLESKRIARNQCLCCKEYIYYSFQQKDDTFLIYRNLI